MTLKLLTGSLMSGLVAFAVLAATGSRYPDRVAASYLVGYLAVTTAVLGVLLVVLIAHSIAVRWIVVVRRLAEHVTATLPWLALGFVPVVVMAHRLYPWARGDVPEHLHTWLSLPWFTVRAVIYFALWIGMAEYVRARALASPPHDVRRFASGSIPIYALTLTSASFDWIMSLTPRWVSTMFGVYIFAAAFVTAFAVLAIIAWGAQRYANLAVSPSHYHAIGRMLFGFVIFWTYIAFSQLFIIYMADLPEEAIWAVHRITPYWRTTTYILYCLHFVVPFFILLPRDIKRRGGLLAAVSTLLVATQVIDMAYLVLPSLDLKLSWLDAVAVIAITCITIAVGVVRSRGLGVATETDPQFAASLRYVS